MEQNNLLFIAFQQGYARRNSNNFSRDWYEFKTNHAHLFQPPSPAKPSANGELLGFLEIEIEKANKNGKDCNLKDGDLNRAQAWYSAAEAFSIVKNKITELLNTPRGHESNIINCPSCNAVWNLSRHNSCQCGATLVTKASPAKAEQEGPWKVKVHHSISDTEAGREYDEYVTITDGRVELYFDGGIDDNDEQLLCNLLNERNIKLDYDHEAELYASQLEELYKEACAEVDRLRKREQEGLRWVKGDYERLFNQIKGGKRTVCYIDHPRFFQQRDICTIKPNNPDMEFSSRGHGYGGINDPGYCGSEIERFIQLCRGLNAEWLDESGLASSRESDLIVLYKEYIHLLGEEIDSLIPIAHTHGWRSERHEKGVQLRAKIEALTQKI